MLQTGNSRGRGKAKGHAGGSSIVEADYAGGGALVPIVSKVEVHWDFVMKEMVMLTTYYCRTDINHI